MNASLIKHMLEPKRRYGRSDCCARNEEILPFYVLQLSDNNFLQCMLIARISFHAKAHSVGSHFITPHIYILELAVYKVAEIAMFDLSTSIKTVWLRQGIYMAHQSHFPSFCDNSIQGWSLSRINILLKLHKKQTI